MTPAVSLPSNERELRLDLFRGLALWLIFIDHVSPDLLTWFTIRNYGFSDAAEIFIFISGYTAAFVYGRAMVRSGFMLASARILKRVWQIYAAHVLLFAILVAEVSYVTIGLEKPFYAKEMADRGFPQAARRKPDSGAAAKISSPEYGRLAALYRADVFSALDPANDKVARQPHARDFGRALHAVMAVRSAPDGLSERFLVVQSLCLAIAVRVRRLVRVGRRQADVAAFFRRRSRCGPLLPICSRHSASR